MGIRRERGLRLLLVPLIPAKQSAQTAHALLGFALQLTEETGHFVLGLLGELLAARNFIPKLIDGFIDFLLRLLLRSAELTLLALLVGILLLAILTLLVGILLLAILTLLASLTLVLLGSLDGIAILIVLLVLLVGILLIVKTHELILLFRLSQVLVHPPGESGDLSTPEAVIACVFSITHKRCHKR
jgi:hypothetical protein